MKKSTFILTLLLLSNYLSAQLYSDILLIEDQYYIVSPSLMQSNSILSTDFLDRHSGATDLRQEFKMTEEGLQFIGFLGDEYSISPDSLFKPSGSYRIVPIENIDRVRRELTNTSITLEYYTEPQVLVLKNGQFAEERYSLDSTVMFIEKGYLEINSIYTEWYDFEVSIYSSDKHILFNQIRSNNGYKVCIELPEGKYDIKYKSEDYEKTINNVKITSNEMTTIDDYYDINTIYQVENTEEIWPGYTNKETNGFFVDLLYGNNKLGIYNLIDPSVNSFGIKAGGTTGRYLGKGFGSKVELLIGYSYRHISIDKDTSLIDISNPSYQAYSTFGINGGTSYTQYFSKYNGKYGNRPFITLGAFYNLPLWFRYITGNGTNGYNTKWRHRYNEVVLFGRIGISNAIALKAEYQIFDVVKSPYPQLPKLTFGISFVFDTYF